MLLDFAGLEYQTQTVGTPDGFVHIDYKKLNKSLLKREKSKLEAKERLRQQLDGLFNPKEPQNHATEIEKPISVVAKESRNLESKLAELTLEIELIQHQIMQNQYRMMQEKRPQEEEFLIMAMTSHGSLLYSNNLIQ